MHMHPTMGYDLARARIADLHRQADRDALARAARQARRTRHDAVSSHRPRRAAATRRRLHAVLVAATAVLRRRALAAPAQSIGQARP